MKVFVPRDAAAIAVGADAVAHALESQIATRRLDIHVVRNGSRGLFWLEPLVEVETPAGRVGYGPVSPDAVAGLLDGGLLEGRQHPLYLGLVEEIPFLKKQERLTFARCGIIDPLSIADYITHDGYRGLQRALEMDRAAIVEEVLGSGLRGRGGAGFPTGIKWRTVLNTPGDQKYIVCNADEGDSGTYADRMIMEGDPFVLIEGMTIAGLAVASHDGLHLHPVGISARLPNDAAGHRGRAKKRLPGRQRRKQRKSFQPGSPARRRSLYLWRGNVAARKPRRQARPDSSQTSTSGDRRTLRQTDRRQQRHFACHRSDHSRQRREVLSELRDGPLARHAHDSARRQHQIRRPG